MSSDLSDGLLGTGDGDSTERRRGADGDGDGGDEEELAKFVFVSIGDRRLAVAVEEVKTVVDPPSDLTRVPRSPTAIEGVTDLRGEITAVIDTREHFAVEGEVPSDQKLVVFDRENDEQSAAMRIDEVLGVESVPLRNVVDAADVDDPAEADGVRSHPLLSGVVRQERRPEVDIREVIGSDPTPESDDDGTEDDARDDASLQDRLESNLSRPSSLGGSIRTENRFDGETFELPEEDGDERGSEEEEVSDDEVVVETTALLDVDELLAVSGNRRTSG